MKRRLPNWIDSYIEYRAETEPPLLFDEWVACSTIAAVLQRKCYLEWGSAGADDEVIYPNLYVVIVGPSAIRKGTSMSPALKLLREVGIHMSAESITREALIQSLEAATDPVIDETLGSSKTHSSLTIFSPELAVFLGYNNPQLVSDLCDLFDCREPWKYQTKASGVNDIAATWLNLIGATTPELLQQLLPQSSIGAGLTSRMIFVFGDKKKKVVPFPLHSKEKMEVRKELIVDLESILTMKGPFALTEEYIDAYIDWYLDHEEHKAIEDVHFQPYLGRRPTHLRKVSMIMSAARSPEMVIRLEDFQKALDLLVRTEQVMPNTFRAYGKSELAEVMDRMMRIIAIRKEITFPKLLREFYRDLTVEDLEHVISSLKKISFITTETRRIGSEEVLLIKYNSGSNSMYDDL